MILLYDFIQYDASITKKVRQAVHKIITNSSKKKNCRKSKQAKPSCEKEELHHMCDKIAFASHAFKTMSTLAALGISKESVSFPLTRKPPNSQIYTVGDVC